MPPSRRMQTPNPSHVGNKTARDRLKEYGSILYVSGTLLFCRGCEISLDHRRKSSIDSHLTSVIHTKKAAKVSEKETNDASAVEKSSSSTKRQVTVDAAFGNASKKAKLDLVNDVVLTFAEADIPLEKLDNPAVRSFFKRYVSNSEAIPSADYLRRGKLEEVYKARMEDIKSVLQAAESVSVMPDETTDVKNRAMMNIIIIPTLSFPNDPKLRPYLVDTVELENVNGSSVAGAVLRSLAELGIPYDKVHAFVSDNVNYMKTAYGIIKAVIPSCVQVGCWAHIFSLVGDTWRHSFPDVDVFVSMMKKLFRNSRAKKGLYLRILAERGFSNPKTPPKPVLTRWSSWLQAVSQHSEYFDAYADLIAALEDRGEDTQAFDKLKELLATDSEELKLKLKFIAVLSENVNDAVLRMQKQEFASHTIYNYALHLLQWLRSLAAKDYLPYVRGAGFGAACSKRIAGEFHSAAVACEDKLSKYVNQDQMAFFKAVRVFDIVQVQTLSKNIEAYKVVPGLQNPNEDLKTEWNIYLDAVPTEPDSTIDLLPFWFGMLKRVPTLAKIALKNLSVPISSVDVERSFSAYNNILADNRQNLKPTNLKCLTGLYFNSHSCTEAQ